MTTPVHKRAPHDPSRCLHPAPHTPMRCDSLTSPGSPPLGVTDRDAAVAPGVPVDARTPLPATSATSDASRGPQAGAGAVDPQSELRALLEDARHLAVVTGNAAVKRALDAVLPAGPYTREAPRTVALPRWIFGRPGHYLVAVRPDGTASIDGDHGDSSGVAHARMLFESLHAIRPPAGTEYVMVTVAAVPENTRLVNEEAVQTLNAITPLATPAPSVTAAPADHLVAEVVEFLEQRHGRPTYAAVVRALASQAPASAPDAGRRAAGEADAVRVFMDGDQWCALAGEDIQSGHAGFGGTPADALRALAQDVDGTPWPVRGDLTTADGRALWSCSNCGQSYDPEDREARRHHAQVSHESTRAALATPSAGGAQAPEVEHG